MMSSLISMTSASTFPMAGVSVPLDRLPVAAVALDASGAIVACNGRFERLSGRPASACQGLPFAEIVVESDRPALAHALADLAAIDDRTAAEPARTMRRVTTMRAVTPPLRLALDVSRLGFDATASYLVCLRADATRRRSDRAAGLEEKARVAGARKQMRPPAVPVGEAWPPSLVTLSHELRGPITAIRGWAQLASEDSLPPEKIARALSLIGRNAASLSELIDGLFDLSRRATGALSLARRPLDVNPLAQLVVDSTLPAARRRRVRLTLRRAPDSLPVDGDPLRLEQVVRNIVENAIKFTPGDGQVEVQTARSTGFAEIVVSDNGPGIPPDLLPVIFEPFRHEDGSVRPSERGLGLGLALVRALVELHDGQVQALSGGPGHGSTFIVRLPLARSAAAA
jgi:nitrogen-specific signal transduction histidine kinase